MKISLLFLPILFIASTAIRAQKIELQKGLISFHSFSGNANDNSGNGNHGIIHGPVLTSDRHGNANSAYYFDGNDDYISVDLPDNIFSSEVSISVWVKTTDPKYQWIAGKYNWEMDAGFHLALLNGIPRFNGRDGNEEYVSCVADDSIIDGHWHHIISIVNEQEWKIYLDGQLAVSINTGHPEVNLNCDLPLEFGRYLKGDWGYHAYYHAYYHGVIDDIYIYNRAISECEVEALYKGIFFPER